MTQSKNRKFDYTLLTALFLLVITGLVILYSTSAYNGDVKFHDSFYYLKKQVFATLLGIAGMFVVANMDYHVWRHFAVLGYLTAILLSVAVLFIGDEINGSKRWLSLGPLSFQPSEFAKVALILFLAQMVTKNVKDIGKMRTMMKIMLMILPVQERMHRYDEGAGRRLRTERTLEESGKKAGEVSKRRGVDFNRAFNEGTWKIDRKINSWFDKINNWNFDNLFENGGNYYED